MFKTKLIFLLLLFALAAFAEETPPPGEAKSTATGTVSTEKKAGRPSSGMTVRTRPKKREPLINRRPIENRKMPPAGSPATGGTSASPGGAPTTPYGSPY